MFKQINFEDTIFILNIRIRMIKDLLKLDIDSAHFFNQTMEDLNFINSTLNILTEKFISNLNLLDRDIEADNLSDAEWEFGQLLNEITNNSGIFPPSRFPDILANIDKIRKDSVNRQKLMEVSYTPVEHAMLEPVVSNAELNGLLGSV